MYLFVIALILLWPAYHYRFKSQKFAKYIPTYRIGGLPFGIPSYFSGTTSTN